MARRSTTFSSGDEEGRLRRAVGQGAGAAEVARLAALLEAKGEATQPETSRDLAILFRAELANEAQMRRDARGDDDEVPRSTLESALDSLQQGYDPGNGADMDIAEAELLELILEHGGDALVEDVWGGVVPKRIDEAELRLGISRGAAALVIGELLRLLTKDEPTELNLWVLGTVFGPKKIEVKIVGDRATAPHIERCMNAGLVESVDGRPAPRIRLTQKGVSALKPIRARQRALMKREGATHEWLANSPSCMTLDMSNIGTQRYRGHAYFWNHGYRHALRNVRPRVRKAVHDAILAAGLPLNGVSAAHEAIIDRIVT